MPVCALLRHSRTVHGGRKSYEEGAFIRLGRVQSTWCPTVTIRAKKDICGWGRSEISMVALCVVSPRDLANLNGCCKGYKGNAKESIAEQMVE